MGYIMTFLETYLVPVIIVVLVFFVIMLLSCFKIFEKAKIDGYKVLIPLYNLYLFVKIADLPIFVVPLLLIPFLNILVFWFVSYRIGDRFHKNVIFNIGLCIFPFLFYPILAFSKSLYKPAEEIGHIRAQEQNSTLYNQFPDVEEVVSEEPLIAPVPLEEHYTESEMSAEPVYSEEMEPQMVGGTMVPPIGQMPENPLGIVEEMEHDNLILDVDKESAWEDKEQLSEAELTKKVVTIDPMKDDPLFNPDAMPVKAASLDQYKVCKHCRARLDMDAKVCFLCGHRIEEEEE